MQITAAFMEKADGAVTRRNIKLKAVELEDPRKDEDLIRVTNCGVCGSDQEIIQGLELVPASGVLGHEGRARRGDRRQRRPQEDQADRQDAMDAQRRGTMPQDPRKKARSPLILPPATGPGDRDQAARLFAPRG